MTKISHSTNDATKNGLSKSLRQTDILALSFGAMIGWSWVVLISQLMQRGGSVGALVATLAAGAVIVVIGLIYAELTSAMPEVGGEHAYSMRALGRNASFFCTWAIVFAYVSVVAFEAVALPSVMENLFPMLGNGELWQVNGAMVYLDQAMIGAVVSIFITWLNIRGVRIAALIQGIVVIVIVLSGLALFVGLGAHGEAANLKPLFVAGGSGVLAAMALVPFMMVGFDVIPQAAEEIDLPPKKIGQILVLSIVLAIAWYLVIELAVGMLLTADQRSAADLATVDATHAAWGREGAIVLLIGGVAGILTSWNGFLIGGSRAIFAMANSGMLPKMLAKVHPVYKTPVNAILFIGVLGTLSPFLGRQALIWFVDGGSFGLMIAYILVTASFLKLRYTEPDMPRPFKVTGGLFLGWFGLFASLLMASLYLPGMPAALVWPQEWFLVLTWFVAGGCIYYLVRRTAE
ncbi:MAG: APA family basic amino acid/polyamine antiporter [Planctomycetaceae bacterium]|jgi:APA family basic amino acid/polyamine antiporter